MARIIAILKSGETFELDYYFEYDLPREECGESELTVEQFFLLFSPEEIETLAILPEPEEAAIRLRRAQETCFLSRRDLVSILEKNEWSQKKTAEELRVSARSVNYLIHEVYQIIPPPGRGWSKHKKAEREVLENVD